MKVLKIISFIISLLFISCGKNAEDVKINSAEKSKEGVKGHIVAGTHCLFKDETRWQYEIFKFKVEGDSNEHKRTVFKINDKTVFEIDTYLEINLNANPNDFSRDFIKMKKIHEEALAMNGQTTDEEVSAFQDKYHILSFASETRPPFGEGTTAVYD